MPKFMNMKNLFFLNLQFFAEEDSTGNVCVCLCDG